MMQHLSDELVFRLAPDMKRRTILRLGAAGTATLFTLGWLHNSFSEPALLLEGRLQPAGRQLMEAVARAVLQGSLSADPARQTQQMAGHLERVSQTLAGFAPHAQAELAQLFAALAIAPGRLALAGMRSPWHEASTEAVSSSLQFMRQSSWAIRQQAYHALRDITNAAHYSDSDSWHLLGYPGPIAV